MNRLIDYTKVSSIAEAAEMYHRVSQLKLQLGKEMNALYFQINKLSESRGLTRPINKRLHPDIYELSMKLRILERELITLNEIDRKLTRWFI